jgi:amino acid adenylation domain-containing protein
MTGNDALRHKLAELSPEQRAEVLRRLAAQRDRADLIPHLPRQDGTQRFPAALGQERLYFLHELSPTSSAYVLPALITLRGELDEQALLAAWRAVAARHEALRTRFELDTERRMVLQVISPPGDAVLDLEAAGATERELPRLMDQFTRRPFDLAAGGLARVRLWRMTDAERTWRLGLALHHIITDGWSLGLLARDLSAAYGAIAGGRPPAMAPPALEYADFAAWQRAWLAGEGPAPHRAYWRARLAGAEPLRVPGDRPEPTHRTFAGRSVPLHLRPEVVAGLGRLGRAHRCTLFVILLASYAYLLQRWSGQSRVLLATPVAGRTRPEFEEIVGFFVNTIALDIDLGGVSTAGKLLARVREAATGAFAHAELPFDQVVRDLAGDRDGGPANPLRVLLTLNNTPPASLKLPGVESVIPEQPRSGTDFDLSLDFTPRDHGGLEGWLVYSADLFGAATATRIAEGLSAALEHLAEAPEVSGDIPLADLRLMPAAARATLLSQTSGAQSEAYPARPLQDWFTDRADESPDRTAVVADAEPPAVLTFRQLDRRANQLAHWLTARGAGAGSRVAICLSRRASLVVALLGVLKAGGICVPLDPDHPRGRVDDLIQDSDPALVLTESAVAGRFGGATTAGTPAVVDLDAVAAELAACPDSRPGVRVDPSDGAYLLYTSGSTGRPKGVVLTHHGIGNRMLGMRDQMGFTADDIVLHKSTINADPAMWEILVPLFCGARTVLARPRLGTDPAYLHDVLARHQVTACEFIPSLLRPVLARPGFGEAARSVRVILSAGEVLPPRLATQLLRALPKARLFNCYGPTETTLDITTQPVSLPVPDPVPIGSPVRGSDLYVVDGQLNLQPPGAPGELVIGGAQVARGYFRRPEQTAGAFVPHPFRPGAVAYRTGDRVRWLPDGSLEFLGRTDRQVKVHGYRVEPGEVESLLRASPLVGDAAVVARPDHTGSHVLHAYVTPAAGQPRPDADGLRRDLGTRVPTPMIPVTITVLPEFPLAASGKVDHSALPQPRPAQPPPTPVPASTSLEEVLLGIWSETLDTRDVGIRDSFFDYGGDSLLATVVVSRVREIFRIELPLHFFVEAPTIEAMSAMVRAQGAQAGVDTERIAAVLRQVQQMPDEEVAARLRD